MKKLQKWSIGLAVVLTLLTAPISMQSATADAAAISTTATGYTTADDVNYVRNGNYLANWGARDEDCVFLSKYAQAFYTGNNVYTTLSQKSGGTSQSNASSSDLYSSLKSFMTSKHSHITTYDETRYQYRYTDCVSGDYAHISSFYSGITLTGSWDSAATWNREHAWPKSKCIDQSKKNDSADIMMLRPTSVKENSSRGNTAYGESSSYYDPGESVRGDCARLVLYGYTRWGNTSYMWGTKGVMENLTVLLKWMEEDPVDTWEMARNDAVQQITGTRNVFVDYPEYAWLLFGQDIPTDMTTPSGIAKNQTSTPPVDSSDSSSDVIDSSTDSSFIDSSSSATDKIDSSIDECEHEIENGLILKMPTETEAGEQMGICSKCGKSVVVPIPPLKQSSDGQNADDLLTMDCSGNIQNGVWLFAILALAGALLFKKKETTQKE